MPTLTLFANHACCSPDEVVESHREETDGKPLDALDGGFLRPFLSDSGAERVFDAFSGMSEALRVAQDMQRAMQDIFPGACLCVPTCVLWLEAGEAAAARAVGGASIERSEPFR